MFLRITGVHGKCFQTVAEVPTCSSSRLKGNYVKMQMSEKVFVDILQNFITGLGSSPRVPSREERRNNSSLMICC